MCIHAASYSGERIADAGPPHTRADVLRPVCARAVRVRLGAHASAPTRASAFRRRERHVARRAGVQLGVGVQREHRRVEHRASHLVGKRMRRPFRPWRRTTAGGTRSVGRRCASRCARRRRRCARARVCAPTCGHAHARASTCVGIAALRKDGRMYACMNMYRYPCIVHTCICICVLV
jgi:hypothetical protein